MAQRQADVQNAIGANSTSGATEEDDGQTSDEQFYTGSARATVPHLSASDSPSVAQGTEVSIGHQFVTPGDLSHPANPTTMTNISDAIVATAAQHLPRSLSADASDGDSEGVATPCSNKDGMGISPDSSENITTTADDVSSLILRLRDPEKIRQVLEALQTNGLLEGSGYKKETTPMPDQTAPEAPNSRLEGQNSCSKCHKFFTRPCELK